MANQIAKVLRKLGVLAPSIVYDDGKSYLIPDDTRRLLGGVEVCPKRVARTESNLRLLVRLLPPGLAIVATTRRS
jgi:hypothetical protein